MASEPAIAPLERAHDDLVSAYSRVLEPGESADLHAHLRIARVLADDATAVPAGRGEVPVPDPPAVRRRAAALEATLADRSPSLGPDPLGRLYETTRSDGDRRVFGQFYTPRPVAAAAAGWALDGVCRSPRVLDPGAGSGTFLVAAMEALDRPADARFVAVDVKRVPLELARLRLGLEADDPPTVRALNASFFDLDPGSPPPAGSVLGDDPGTRVGSVDAVIGNPPFVRGEALDADGAHYRSHLATFGADGTPYLDGDRAIGRRSDAYVYFLTQATRFLRDGGRLAFVLPTKWLMSGYGESLQRFLFDHYAVAGVIGLDDAFDDALIDTCLLLATRETDSGARAASPIRFVPDGIAAGEPLVPDEGSARGLARTQGDLATGKLDRFLAAPDWLRSIEDTERIVPLEAVAAVSRGVMTGANRFFFVDRADRDRWGIEPDLLRPAVKSLREIESPVLRSGAVDRWLVDVNGYVRPLEDGSTASRVKAALARDGLDGLRGYVDHAEAEGWHEGRTCRERPVWFDLGPLPEPDAFVPKLLRERLFVIRNRAGATPSNAIDCLAAADGVDPDALVAVLNSSLVRAAMEVRGRNEAGMLQLMTYETAGLPIPDPRRLSPTDRADLVDAFEGVVSGQPGAPARLDRVVHGALELGVAAADARTAAERLRRDRLAT